MLTSLVPVGTSTDWSSMPWQDLVGDYLIAAAIMMVLGLAYPLKNIRTHKPESLATAFYEHCDPGLFIVTMLLALAASSVLAPVLWYLIITNHRGSHQNVPLK